ncbi:PREDICTED: zinc finger CCCH domain-containing protein 23 [Tarenaya hassleriana]|uniref:zinc finger CCCH domain-containing protein 23 n=1 Tax=Tarenaya hassleriana TaxID=28532 RepID=UPI00053C9785|nr:PREDICTED: zinc finger CCCH domain-containing protein 23 [Tarenaya hassleriana]
MIIGERSRSHPTVQIPSWDPPTDPTVTLSSVNFNGVGDYPLSPSPYLDSIASLYRYLPSNEFAADSDSLSGDESGADAFACDDFRMYEFKVRRCSRSRSHDWTECPFAHPGEKARRRDPRKYHYSGTACPEFRKGSCRKGDSCEFAHGVFECWLHPARYRTQPCKDGTSCQRRVCFFAHTPEQLRVLSGSGESDLGLCVRNRFESHFSKSVIASSPTSILVSPPISPPSDSPTMSSNSDGLIPYMRKMRLSGGSWGSPVGSGFGSRGCAVLRPGFCSTPTTPTRARTWLGLGEIDAWDAACEEGRAMELVESGKELRARMYAKLSKENSLGRVDLAVPGPDIEWVSELFK